MTAIKVTHGLGGFSEKKEYKAKIISRHRHVAAFGDAAAEKGNGSLHLRQVLLLLLLLLFLPDLFGFCFVPEGRCSQAPTSRDSQKINPADDAETIAHKVNEILLQAG